MILYLLAYLGGVLTIVSPCILPVIPFVLARADRPFLRNGLPMLIGMSLAFAVVATLASVAGGWVVSANQYGRGAALVLLAIFGLTLVFPELADRLMRPLVAVGARISQSAEQPGEESVVAPFVLGNGAVTTQRLYQLIRTPDAVADHTFEIRFLEPGVQAYAFTFG